MTTGAIVGIAVGASLLFLGGTALFWVYYRKQKHLYEDFDSHYDPRAGSKSISPPLVGGFNSIETSDQAQLSDYELKAQQSYGNNADFYDSVEKEMLIRRPHYAFDPNKPGSGPSGALPAHPAYINQALSRNSSRGISPQPPRPIKSNKPDSYALATYLAANEDAINLPGPPPGPPPSIYARGTSAQPNRDSLAHLSHVRTPSNSSAHSAAQPTAMRPPPPPPPRREPKVPSLSLPSVPRIRIPKKYSPPKIQIEGATPVAEQGEVLPIGLQISNPVIEHDKRFVEDPFEARRRANQQQAQDIIEQKVVDRRPRHFIEEVSIQTGKSSMYG